MTPTPTLSSHPSRRSHAVRRTAHLLPQQTQVGHWLFSRQARPVRFALVGAGCGLLQLLLLFGLTLAEMPGIPANIAAYLLSAQANFLLSNRFIWHDRWSDSATHQDLIERWLSFHGSIAGTFLLSQAVFIAGRLLLPDVVASALGIGASAVANFAIQDRLTFRLLRRSSVPEQPAGSSAQEGLRPVHEQQGWRQSGTNGHNLAHR